MAVPIDILNDLASVLSIQVESSTTVQPGQPLLARIVPPASDLRAADVLSMPATLTWITKNLIFAANQTGLQSEPLTNLPNINGPMPIASVTQALTAVPGIPGLVGQLDALLPIPLQVPVGLRVAWTIKKGASTVDPGDSTYFSSDQLGSYDDVMKVFTSVGVAQVIFSFIPQTVELTSDLKLTSVAYTINATVQVFVGGSASDPLVLRPIPITVPAIPIPYAVAFFRHSNYQNSDGGDEGFALIVVPSNSLFRDADVKPFQDKLRELQTTIGGLQQFAAFASLAIGLSALTDNLTAQPYIVLKAVDSISPLADVQIKDTSWTDWRGINANDEISSLIVIGPKGDKVQCNNETEQKDDEGRFTVTLGDELYVKVPNLVIDSSSQSMTSEPPGRITVDKMPSSYVTAATFNDELSSVSLRP